MSFIRALEKRKFSKGGEGLYVFPTEDSIDCCADWEVPKEDWIEIMFRMLERVGIKFNLKDINKVRKSIYLKPIKKVLSDKESTKAYFKKLSQKTGRSEK